MQTLDVKVAIPEDYILIKKVDWEDMINNQLSGMQWEMKDLTERTGRSPQWIKENILYPYKDELDVNVGGFVKYPDKQGMSWRFGAIKMSQWLEKNLEKVL